MRAVDGVSFQVFPGETLGIVGESGSGKSVTALSIIRLLQEQSRIASGKIVFRDHDIVAMNEDEVRSLRGGKIAMVFQDPMTSLNPVRRISDQLVEAMVIHGRHDRPSALRRAIDLLGRMGITAPERAIAGFPHQFSGGMRQRVMLAMGFSNEPVAAARGRTDDGARRDDPGADPGSAARAQRRFRRGHRPDQPRPRRHRQCLQPRRRDVRGRSGGGGIRPKRCLPIRSIRTRGRCSMRRRGSTGTRRARSASRRSRARRPIR